MPSPQTPPSPRAPEPSSAPISRTTSRNKLSASPHFRLQRQRTETDALLAAQHDEEDFADSDGLYPPRCTWTSREEELYALSSPRAWVSVVTGILTFKFRGGGQPPESADPFSNRKCNVYENI